jgi:Flp pilus assembly protein TadG
MLRKLSFLPTRLQKLWASKSGGVIIYIAFAMPMLLGAMALSVDLGRSFILNTELKDFSDAAALAGAAELDGRVGAMVAAEAAARSGITGTLVNVQVFATDGGGPNIVVDQVVFLQDLPADGTNFVAGDTATSDQDARFIFVSVIDRSVRSGLSRGLGVIPDFNTGARSIAGFNTVVCRLPAMFMCNPLEDTSFPIAGLAGCSSSDLGTGKPLKDECLQGRGMLLKNGGGGGAGQGQQSQYFPGEFGLLDCPDGLVANNNGIRCVAESIAQSAPNVCITSRAFVQTGQGAGPIREAINTRFDIYHNPFYGHPSIKSDPIYRAPLNVTKGYEPTGGQNCSEEAADPATVAPLPRDTCFATDTCASGRWGQGDWYANGQGDDYWDMNHGNSGAVKPDLTQMTRYDLYRLEIESEYFGAAGPGVPEPGGAPNGPTFEDGKACNYTGGTFSDPGQDANDTGLDEIDRRLLVLTAVNCVEHGPFQGSQPEGVPVEGYIQVFLTEPAEHGGPEQLKVWGELAGVIERGTDGLRDIVQLYR